MEVEKIRERRYVDYTVQSQHALDIVIEKFKTEKPKGHWVADFYEKNWETKYYNWHCSECGAEFGDSRPIWNYCPHCGANMRSKDCERNTNYEQATAQLEYDIQYEPTYNPEDGSA